MTQIDKIHMALSLCSVIWVAFLITFLVWIFNRVFPKKNKQANDKDGK